MIQCYEIKRINGKNCKRAIIIDEKIERNE